MAKFASSLWMRVSEHMKLATWPLFLLVLFLAVGQRCFAKALECNRHQMVFLVDNDQNMGSDYYPKISCVLKSVRQEILQKFPRSEFAIVEFNDRKNCFAEIGTSNDNSKCAQVTLPLTALEIPFNEVVENLKAKYETGRSVKRGSTLGLLRTFQDDLHWGEPLTGHKPSSEKVSRSVVLFTNGLWQLASDREADCPVSSPNSGRGQNGCEYAAYPEVSVLRTGFEMRNLRISAVITPAWLTGFYKELAQQVGTADAYFGVFETAIEDLQTGIVQATLRHCPAPSLSANVNLGKAPVEAVIKRRLSHGKRQLQRAANLDYMQTYLVAGAVFGAFLFAAIVVGVAFHCVGGNTPEKKPTGSEDTEGAAAEDDKVLVGVAEASKSMTPIIAVSPPQVDVSQKESLESKAPPPAQAEKYQAAQALPEPKIEAPQVPAVLHHPPASSQTQLAPEAPPMPPQGVQGAAAPSLEPSAVADK